ncbi:secretion pathway protein [Halocynthia phage JM-2012]|uniref:secretion pathway protein n=1 Tax=Halocynthia phage JM-2012 TaxID=1173297 RepID=UPI00025C690F|nr:secretion pathway protein [Halocynthia phage JM-2012]AFI55342.1 secretion pathway protein [Halocynthia phage JM-2012]
MYQIVSALRYLDGKWVYDEDANVKTIATLIEETRFNLITLISNGKYYLLDNSFLNTLVNRSQSLGNYLANSGVTLPEIEEPVDLESIGLRDCSGIERSGNDYIFKEPHPFVVGANGINKVTSSIVAGLHTKLLVLEDFILGYLDTELIQNTVKFSISDFNSTVFKLPKKFKLNNTLMVFGDSLIKANSVLYDDGESYRLTQGYAKWLVDLYIDNLTRIPPTNLGLNPKGMSKDELLSLSNLKKLFTHNNVYFVELENDYPIGSESIEVINEYIDDYYDGIVMYGTKPTTKKIIHRRNLGYGVQDIVGTGNLQTFNDNPTITMAAEDRVMKTYSPTVMLMDYPIVKRK